MNKKLNFNVTEANPPWPPIPLGTIAVAPSLQTASLTRALFADALHEVIIDESLLCNDNSVICYLNRLLSVRAASQIDLYVIDAKEAKELSISLLHLIYSCPMGVFVIGSDYLPDQSLDNLSVRTNFKVEESQISWFISRHDRSSRYRSLDLLFANVGDTFCPTSANLLFYSPEHCSRYFALAIREIFDPLSQGSFSLSFLPKNLPFNKAVGAVLSGWSEQRLIPMLKQTVLTYTELMSIRKLLAPNETLETTDKEVLQGALSKLRLITLNDNLSDMTPVKSLELILNMGLTPPVNNVNLSRNYDFAIFWEIFFALKAKLFGDFSRLKISKYSSKLINNIFRVMRSIVLEEKSAKYSDVDKFLSSNYEPNFRINLWLQFFASFEGGSILHQERSNL